MKNPCPATLISLCAALLLSACAPAGYADGTIAGDRSDSRAHSAADTGLPAGDAAIEALRARYESELTALRRELAALRAEDTAARLAYEARIEAMESTLAHLRREVGISDQAPEQNSGRNAGQDPGLDPSQSPSDSPAKAPNDREITVSATVDPPCATVTSPWGDVDETPEMTAFHYRIEGSTAVIRGYTGAETDVVIPAAIDGYPVTRIADNAFAGTGVRTVFVPAGVTRIGWFAFYGCTALEAVALPGSVEAIDYGAFDVCPAVTVYAPADSYAAAYAAAYGYRWMPME